MTLSFHKNVHTKQQKHCDNFTLFNLQFWSKIHYLLTKLNYFWWGEFTYFFKMSNKKNNENWNGEFFFFIRKGHYIHFVTLTSYQILGQMLIIKFSFKINLKPPIGYTTPLLPQRVKGSILLFPCNAIWISPIIKATRMKPPYIFI